MIDKLECITTAGERIKQPATLDTVRHLVGAAVESSGHDGRIAKDSIVPLLDAEMTDLLMNAALDRMIQEELRRASKVPHVAHPQSGRDSAASRVDSTAASYRAAAQQRLMDHELRTGTRLGDATRVDIEKEFRICHDMGTAALRRRSVMFILGECLIRKNGDYKAIYDSRKSYEHARAPEMTKAEAHFRAHRYMEKRFLLNLWKAWIGQQVPDSLKKIAAVSST